MRFLPHFSLLLTLLLAATGHSQTLGSEFDKGANPGSADNASASKLLICKIRHVPAADTAETISSLFHDDGVLVIPNHLANTLFIRATPQQCQQVLEVVESLDRPPETVVLQTIIVRSGAKDARRLAAIEALTDAKLLEEVRLLEDDGDFEVERLKITSVENLSSTVEVESSEPGPVADGQPGGGAPRQTTNAGCQLSATHRVSGDRIAIDLRLEKSVATGGIGRGQVGATSTLAVHTTVQVPDGGAVAIQSALTGDSGHTVVVVAARIAKP